MGRVNHFELQADDPERAIRFYSTCFGWAFARWDGPHEYWIITTGPPDVPGIDGGMVRRTEPIDGVALTAFVCSVSVDQMAAALAAVDAAGGQQVRGPSAIPGVGWLAHVRDSEGNLLCLFQDDPGAGGEVVV